MSFYEQRIAVNIKPTIIKNKEKYILDLYNIENSFTGRIDANVANIFISEATQLVVNSIVLFEKGYFDVAYYSLRQAVELSTVMVYLSDIPNKERDEKLVDWKQQKRFPMRNQMLKYLKVNGFVISEMKEKMEFYFDEVELLNQELNKFVHKQGFKNFYTSRSLISYYKKEKIEELTLEYESYLYKCIGTIAIMRLAIDPFPILLMDEEIYFRTNSFTVPYSNDFVEEYLTEKIIESYKTTELYKQHYDSIIQNEKMSETTLYVVKDHYIERSKIDKIQIHLLREYESIPVILAKIFSKATKIYTFDGMISYFTDKKTNRTKLSWSTEDFIRFSNSEVKENQPYDEVFITVINIGKENYYLEHNEKMEKSDFKKLEERIEKGIFEDITKIGEI